MSNQSGLKKVVFAAVAAVCSAFGAFGVTYYAAPDGTTTGDGSESSPFDVYTAITKLAYKTDTADTVILKPGEYQLKDCIPDGASAINYDQAEDAAEKRNKCLTVRGMTGAAHDVVINGNGAYRFLGLKNKEPSGVTLEVFDLTVSNCCSSASRAGAAIGADLTGGSMDAPPLTVSNCVFVASLGTAQDSQGAIYARFSRVSDCLFDACTVTNQTGTASGGAIACYWNGMMVERCVFRNCHTYTVANQNSYGGAAHLGGSSRVSDCWFEYCSAESANNKGEGGAIFGNLKTVIRCSFSNCWAKVGGGAVCRQDDSAYSDMYNSTIADCRAPTGAAASRSYNLHGVLVQSCSGNTIFSSTYRGADLFDSVFRDNEGSYSGIFADSFSSANGGAHMISNCVFTGNSAPNSNNALFTTTVSGGSLLMTDCCFLNNTFTSRGLLNMTGNMGTEGGVVVRNSYFGVQKNNANSPYLYLNYTTGNTAPTTIENCTFVMRNFEGAWFTSFIGTPASCLQLRNSFFMSQTHYYFGNGAQSPFASTDNVRNCVLVDFGMSWRRPDLQVNMDPAYGNCVKTLADLKFAGGTTVSDPAAFDWRPTKGSPLVDACTNKFDVSWAQDCTKKRGPWDMGDGTWTETPYATVTACGGIPGYEKTFQTGVVIARNNANPRRYNNYLDVGCFEYWTAPGLMLLVW